VKGRLVLGARERRGKWRSLEDGHAHNATRGSSSQVVSCRLDALFAPFFDGS
jgi:hypothetical protein